MMRTRHQMAVAVHLWLSDDAGRILFMRRHNSGYADGQWSVPAGHVERGESLVAACLREAFEEIGIRVKASALEFRLLQHKRDIDGEERIDVFFAATCPPGQRPRIVEPHRCDAIEWRPRLTPPLPLVPYVAAALIHTETREWPSINCWGFDDDDGSCDAAVRGEVTAH